MVTAANFSNYTLAAGTLVAALFVAVQAYYARSSYVEGEATRFLERKLDICFENFDAAAQAGTLPEGFDERFIRLWRFYLMYCEGGFRAGGIDVSQVTLVKPA